MTFGARKGVWLIIPLLTFNFAPLPPPIPPQTPQTPQSRTCRGAGSRSARRFDGSRAWAMPPRFRRFGRWFRCGMRELRCRVEGVRRVEASPVCCFASFPHLSVRRVARRVALSGNGRVDLVGDPSAASRRRHGRAVGFQKGTLRRPPPPRPFYLRFNTFD